MILEPTFSEYAAAARAAGLEPVRRVARSSNAVFRFDAAVLEDLDGVSLVFLCNPNNPTGDALERAEVLEVADRVRGKGAVLLVDEAFADFARSPSSSGCPACGWAAWCAQTPGPSRAFSPRGP